MNLPTNWWHEPPARPTPPMPVTWIREPAPLRRPDPRPRPTAPVRRPERPRPALRLADGMVDLGERLALYLAGFSIGAALVVLVNHLFGGA